MSARETSPTQIYHQSRRANLLNKDMEMLEPCTPGKVLGLVELDFLRCASLSSSLKYFNLSWLFPLCAIRSRWCSCSCCFLCYTNHFFSLHYLALSFSCLCSNFLKALSWVCLCYYLNRWEMLQLLQLPFLAVCPLA